MHQNLKEWQKGLDHWCPCTRRPTGGGALFYILWLLLGHIFPKACFKETMSNSGECPHYRPISLTLAIELLDCLICCYVRNLGDATLIFAFKAMELATVDSTVCHSKLPVRLITGEKLYLDPVARMLTNDTKVLWCSIFFLPAYITSCVGLLLKWREMASWPASPSQ